MLHRWKILFSAAAILLAGCVIICGVLGYKLNATEAQLNATKTQLESAKTQLDASKTELESTRSQLDASEAELEDTEIRLVATENLLDIRETELDATRSQLEVMDGERNQILARYSKFREQINMRLGSGYDCQSFITPDDPTISDKVREITGGYSEDVNEYWRDFERLYRWVTRNIEYSYDSYTPVLPEIMERTLIWSREFWRMPAETLEDKTGDCEDMTALLASMLLNYNEGRFAVWCVVIRTPSPEVAGHVAVAFPVEGEELTILDPAGNYLTGFYGSIGSKDVAVAIREWLSHWEREMPGAQIYMAFSTDFYREFSSTEEFINWVRER